MKQRQGVLGLDTAKAVIVTFLILAVMGISILLALTSLQTATDSSKIDTSTAHDLNTVVNETGTVAQGKWINSTGYTLASVNASTEQFTILYAWNQTSHLQIPSTNYSITAGGVVYNTTSVAPYNNWNNVTFTYTYINNYDYDNGRVTSIVGNVSGGIVTFFGSTGTIFSILIVVIIILAISIIIWAVGRFGQPTENEQVNL
jgi:hypothetical protein